MDYTVRKNKTNLTVSNMIEKSRPNFATDSEPGFKFTIKYNSVHRFLYLLIRFYILKKKSQTATNFSLVI